MKSISMGLVAGFLVLVSSLAAECRADEVSRVEVRASRSLAAEATDPYYISWKVILDRFVSRDGSQSQVDYAALKADPKALESFLSQVSAVTQHDYESWPEHKKLAFLMNSYNAFTVKLIIDHFPVKSIKDIGSVFKKPWGIKFFKLLGEERSLDEVEHDMIRKQFNEPRIHMALVCAAKSCPPLSPYSASQVDDQLEKNTLLFVKDPKRNRYDAKEKKLYLSSIFKWYGDDFKKKFGTVKSFVAPKMAASKEEAAVMKSDETEVSFLDYDWSLNKK